MGTSALDLATIIKAFLVLEQEKFFPAQMWEAINPSQVEVFELLATRRDEVAKLRDLVGSAKSHPDFSISVISVLDKTVRWLDGKAQQNKNYPGFKLKKGCSVYTVEGFEDSPLLEIVTKNGDRLCLMMHTDQLAGMELVKTVFDVLKAKRKFHLEYEMSVEASIPCVNFDLRPDISFLVGAFASKDGNNWTISKADQRFRFRMNEEGARALVETSMMILGCCIERNPRKKKIVIDQPFIGWFMQSDCDFPMAVFYADVDSWKDSGKLENL